MDLALQTQNLHAIYENGVFRPMEPVDIPDGCEVEIRVQPRRTTMRHPTLVRLAEIGRQFPPNPELPDDLAAQHDHYLYGLPKQP